MKDSNSLKYKYIVVGYGYDYYYYVYHQLTELPNTVFVDNWPTSLLYRRLYNYYFSHNLPFKCLWVLIYAHFLKVIAKKKNFSDTDNICFLLLAGGANNALLSYGLTKKIKSIFVNSKIVFFINDLVTKTGQPVYLMKEHADFVYSYDPKDCEKYSLLNHVIPYSNYPFSLVKETKYDIVFVGAAKDRLKDILSVYFHLSGNGVKCFFIIIDVPKEEQVPATGIYYSGRISYRENICLLQKGNCILDIIQGESSGNTIRVGEAIILDKKLLTNNSNTPYNGVFDNSNMRVFDSIENIDIPFLLDKSPIRYNIKEKMYPVDLLHNIDERLINE